MRLEPRQTIKLEHALGSRYDGPPASSLHVLVTLYFDVDYRTLSLANHYPTACRVIDHLLHSSIAGVRFRAYNGGLPVLADFHALRKLKSILVLPTA